MDALPDERGRRLLAAAITSDGGTPTLPEMLLRMRGGGTGPLLFTVTDTTPHPDQSVQSTELSKLLAAAARFEAGTLPPGCWCVLVGFVLRRRSIWCRTSADEASIVVLSARHRLPDRRGNDRVGG